ncbi:N-acyl homoserine lactonase family protein [Pseudonocardia zijingensis]|jgi:glyoxylase-like metal-dependent hydrolase (beta-lactamase superfamily II)|uniref:N-acyl homoserine lactonase family protein n=1 Tax=Pseudonocardia zijingensis TaxID=153376 RepID=A0ABP3YJY4_9PSEU
MSATYEVYALRYATLPDRSRRENFLHSQGADDEPMPLDYYVWLVRGGGRTIVVDTGCTPQVAAARGRTFLHTVPDLLAEVGVTAADVADVVLTHLHYDHAGGTGWFPGATFHVQRSEQSYATGPPMAHPLLAQPFEPADVSEVVRLVHAGRVRLHDGRADLADGVELHRIGGHTGGLQVVRVRTDAGWLVLASDALHFTENRTTGNPFPLVVDVAEMLEGFRTCERLATRDELVVPGHDPAVRHGAQGTNPDVVRLA